MRTERPASFEEAAEVMRAAGSSRAVVRFRGGGTKMSWGAPVPEPDVEVTTGSLDGIVEHNAGDLTAIILAGTPLTSVHATFAEAGQMLAIDPPVGSPGAATIGGVVATGDSGPLRHRYGGPRDLLLGVNVALSDGTLAQSGGKVIKNVAGYDLAKLLTGSFGTLGFILQVVVRLHPLPLRRLTVIADVDDPDRAQRAALALARAPLELESLDIAWQAGRGRVLARCAGGAVEDRARHVVRLLVSAGINGEIVQEDESIWSDQRDTQRSPDGVVLRVSGLPSAMATLLRAADRAGGSVTGRAGAGLSWVSIGARSVEDAVGAVEELRRALDPFPCAVLDAPPEVRDKVDVWGTPDGPLAALTRRVKAGFDPPGVCNPGIFVGGI